MGDGCWKVRLRRLFAVALALFRRAREWMIVAIWVVAVMEGAEVSGGWLGVAKCRWRGVLGLGFRRRRW